MALKLMYITNNLKVAQIAESNGVDRIFVDVEIIGKRERQHNMDTVISCHSISDVAKIKKGLKTAELLVRINPINENSKTEIENVIAGGADVIMLPMISKKTDAEQFLKMVGGRCRTMLLIETIYSEKHIEELCNMKGVDEIHIGLNDLHLQHKKEFMFELLTDGTVQNICNVVRKTGKPYGFGGIAGLDTGTLPARYVIAEHYRLGSVGAILSRSFCNAEKIADASQINEQFEKGMAAIRKYEKELKGKSNEFFEENRKIVEKKVAEIVDQKDN